MRCERGQATIEWVGLVLLASLALGALATAVPAVDGRSLGGLLAHRIVCAARGSPCDDGQAARARVRRPGRRAAAPPRARASSTSRASARCRSTSAAAASAPARTRPTTATSTPTARDAGRRATAFTRVVRRGGTHLPPVLALLPRLELDLGGLGLAVAAQSAGAGRDPVGHRPRPLSRLPRRRLGGLRGAGRPRRSRGGALHLPRPLAVVQAGACRDRWGPRTGWTRVSRGSHAGHIPLDRAPAARRAGSRPGSRAGRQALPGPHPGREHARAHHHRGGAAAGAARDARRAAATGRWSRT